MENIMQVVWSIIMQCKYQNKAKHTLSIGVDYHALWISFMPFIHAIIDKENVQGVKLLKTLSQHIYKRIIDLVIMQVQLRYFITCSNEI